MDVTAVSKATAVTSILAPFLDTSAASASRFSPNHNQYALTALFGLFGSVVLLLLPSFSLLASALSARRLPATPPAATNAAKSFSNFALAASAFFSYGALAT